MAHIGQKLRFVLARLGEFSALLLDLAEEARVLDRQYRLVGEGFEKIDRAPRKFAGCLEPDNQLADYLSWA